MLRLLSAGLFGMAVGIITGSLIPKPKVPCDFCGYRDDETKELFEVHELQRLLEEGK